jgi:hypothetical protein
VRIVDVSDLPGGSDLGDELPEHLDAPPALRGPEM